MAGHRDTPPVLNRDVRADVWPPGFAYDLNVAIPPTTPASGRSYTDVTADSHPNQRRLPNEAALRDGFISSPAGGERPPTTEGLEGTVGADPSFLARQEWAERLAGRPP